VAQNGRIPTQNAGLDLTPQCWRALGRSDGDGKASVFLRRSGKIQWEFVQEPPMKERIDRKTYISAEQMEVLWRKNHDAVPISEMPESLRQKLGLSK
jgi:hypothetical protein